MPCKKFPLRQKENQSLSVWIKTTDLSGSGEYDISADDLLSGNNRGQKIKEAKEFLLEILADGAVEQNLIIRESESYGIKGKTLWNAKKALGVQSIKTGGHWSGDCRNNKSTWQDYHFFKNR